MFSGGNERVYWEKMREAKISTEVDANMIYETYLR